MINLAFYGKSPCLMSLMDNEWIMGISSTVYGRPSHQPQLRPLRGAMRRRPRQPRTGRGRVAAHQAAPGAQATRDALGVGHLEITWKKMEKLWKKWSMRIPLFIYIYIITISLYQTLSGSFWHFCSSCKIEQRRAMKRSGSIHHPVITQVPFFTLSTSPGSSIFTLKTGATIPIQRSKSIRSAATTCIPSNSSDPDQSWLARLGQVGQKRSRTLRKNRVRSVYQIDKCSML